MRRLWKLMDRQHLLVIFLLIIAEAVGMLVLPSLAADTINLTAVHGSKQKLAAIAVIMIAAVIFTIIVANFASKFCAQESQELGNKVRKKLFHKIMSFSQEDLTKFSASTLLTRTTNDVMQIQLVTMMILRQIVTAPIIIIVSFAFALYRETRLAWIFAITLPLIVVGATVILKVASPLFGSIQSKTDRLNKVFREGLTGIRVIRAFNTTKYEEERFDDANRDFRDTSIKAYTITNLMLPMLLLILGLSNILIFTGGSHLIAFGQMQVGDLVAYINYGVQILNSVLLIAMLLFFLPRAEVSAERVLEVLDTEPSIQDKEETVTIPDNQATTLDFDHVGFGFPGAERLAVKDIDFHAKAGDTIAIIGGTGSGKTTIASLIPRLYDADEGSVRINGVDVKDAAQSDLRQRIGYAPQKAMLFSGTIRSNIQYGKADATDDEIWHALDIAQAEFVREYPDGLDHRVEQGGNNFSGGQKQRLAIARAIVSKPDIYVFDDSFSALDFKTDSKVRHALKPETKNAVTVIIAQRVNTVMDADSIIVLDQGRIVGQGTHEELLASNKVYQDIVNSQLKGDAK